MSTVVSTYETVLVEKDNGVVTVTLNRPKKKNCMSPTMHREMVDVLKIAARDKETRVLVITGAGDAFCAGQDLKEFFYDQRDPHEFEPIVEASIDWRVRLLRAFPAPTIAAVNGWCFGGAFSIVASCDIAIAADEATFGLSEINFGNFPGGLVTKQVADVFRPRDAMFYILTGRQFSGKKAAELGFVTYSVPKESLMADVKSLAKELAEKEPTALRMCKDVYRASLEMPNYEVALMWSMAKSDSLSLLQNNAWVEKGIGQFLEGKYRPGFGAFDKDAK